jgi:ribosomal protein S18 acetylase RimI-like enzyme
MVGLTAEERGRVVIVLTEKPGSPTEQEHAIDALVRDMIRRIHPPVGLLIGPWPLTADNAGIGDDVHRAMLVDDWAESGMRAAQLRKLIEVQLVARNRQFSAEHPRGRDLGITVRAEIVGRVLLDLDDSAGPGDHAAVTLVDIAVHPLRQRQGIGGAALTALLAAAAAADRPVRVTAVFGTPALNWYLASGFVEVGGDVLYHQLIWRP